MGDADGVRNAGTGPSKTLEYYGTPKSLAHNTHTLKEVHRCEYTSPTFYLQSRNIDVVPAQAPAPDANYVFSSHCMIGEGYILTSHRYERRGVYTMYFVSMYDMCDSDGVRK